MKRIWILLLLTFFMQFVFSQDSSKYLIKAGKFFDAVQKTFLKNQFILIEGDKIKKVFPSNGKTYSGYKIIDLSSSTVMPGLIDAHTHFLFMQKSGTNMELDLIEHSDAERLLRASDIARSFLMAGVTTVRDLGNSGPYLDVTLRDALKKNLIIGPDMFVSGPIICPPGGQFSQLDKKHQHLIKQEYTIVTDVAEAKAAIHEHVARGVDLIKICATNDNGLEFSDDILKVLVEEAHAKGLKVTAHATYDAIVRKSVLAGVDGIEHGYGISDSTLMLMAKRKVYLVPTDGTFDGYKGIVNFSKSSISDDDIRAFVASTKERLQRAVKYGVPIVFGSDLYLYTPKSIGVEAKNALVSYWEAGIPVKDVLQIGTFNAAKAIGKETQFGAIQAGAKANIIAFKGDIEKFFLKLIYEGNHFVMKNGKIIKSVNQ